MNSNKFKNGDTLIEVLLAMSIFASLMVGALYLMNSGLSKAQTTLQITMARNLMDSQAEFLRYSNAAFIANYPREVVRGSAASRWQDYIGDTRPSASNLNDCSDKAHSFVINPVNGEKITRSLVDANTFPMIAYDLDPGVNNNDSNHIRNKNNFSQAQGIWVQAIQGDHGKFYDFHIRACWQPAGSVARLTLGTVVRLYAPTR